MNDIDRIVALTDGNKQLCHASNLLAKLKQMNLSAKQKNGLSHIVKHYLQYISFLLQHPIKSEEDIEECVAQLNSYYNFIHNNNYDNLFTSQGKFRPSILEEFLYLLFKETVEDFKRLFDTKGVLSSGSVKAYTNLFFKAKDFPSFIQEPEIGINEKDQDYAIYRTFNISIDNAEPKKVQVPVIAVEAKTYIDKTMMDTIIATADKLKNGNPYARFVAVAEWYDVAQSVDPYYSRIDQIYILRKGMRRDAWQEIDHKVVATLYIDTLNHLHKPWSDVQKRLNENGLIIFV